MKKAFGFIISGAAALAAGILIGKFVPTSSNSAIGKVMDFVVEKVDAAGTWIKNLYAQPAEKEETI